MYVCIEELSESEVVRGIQPGDKQGVFIEFWRVDDEYAVSDKMRYNSCNTDLVLQL